MITDTVPLEGLTNAITDLLERAPQCKVMVDPWARPNPTPLGVETFDSRPFL